MTPEGPSAYSLAILKALQGKASVYLGTVSPATIDRRRAANKMAKRSRKLNRGTR